jgi:uncharacterized membrane protein
MITVTLYTRQNCHLCEQARTDLEQLQEKYPHKLVVIDVDSNADLRRTYGLEVPVAVIEPFRLKAPFSIKELEVTLAAALDRERHIQRVENSPHLEAVRGEWTRADGFNLWLSNHYMAVINLVVIIYLGFTFLAPVLMKVGAVSQANFLYRGYSFLCHQLGYRSFYLFGEQPFYPRQAAGVKGYLSFSQATGMSEADNPEAIFNARLFVGNETVGYKVALCERDVAMYAGILLFGLLFALVHFRLPPIPWYVWLLVGVFPIAIDGFSQLFSQAPFHLLPFRESTPFLRILTGGLFGFFTAWFGFPLVEESMAESRKLMSSKWLRLHPAVKS